jgi:hypothetical protein
MLEVGAKLKEKFKMGAKILFCRDEAVKKM